MGNRCSRYFAWTLTVGAGPITGISTMPSSSLDTVEMNSARGVRHEQARWHRRRLGHTDLDNTMSHHVGFLLEGLDGGRGRSNNT